MALPFLPNFRAWQLENVENRPFQRVRGDFEAYGINRNVSTSWIQHKSLGVQKPLLQFLSGNADKLSFTGRLYQYSALDNITEKFQTLVAWANRDPDLKRPPILLFSVGNGDAAYFDGALSVIDSITDIQYDSPTVLGQVRGITFTVNLLEYTEFSVENLPPHETRYAIAKTAEYMELLAEREYADPMLGDILRRRMPDLQIVQAGDTIKLPSRAAIQSIPIAPVSIALLNTQGSKDSPQKALRDLFFARNNRPYKSLIVPEGL